MAKKFVRKYLKQKASEIIEPDVSNATSDKSIKIFNWYNVSDFNDKERKKWVIQYAKEKNMEWRWINKINEKNIISTLSTICRIASRGCTITEKHQKFIEQKFEELKKIIPVETSKTETNKPKFNIQERIYEQAGEVMAEVHEFVDAFVEQGIENKIINSLDKKGFGRPQTKHIINLIERYIEEFITVKNAKVDDKELFESYNLSIRKINSIIKYLESLKVECEKWILVKKKIKKLSETKIKTPYELCKNVKINKNTEIKPEKVVGAMATVLQNTRNKSLMFLVYEDKFLSIKGTTITNVDLNKSTRYIIKNKFKEKAIKELRKIKNISKLKTFLNNEEKFKKSKQSCTGRLGAYSNIILVI